MERNDLPGSVPPTEAEPRLLYHPPCLQRFGSVLELSQDTGTMSVGMLLYAEEADLPGWLRVK